MKVIHPFGVGRLARAVICGLVAAIVIPATASAASPVVTAPFYFATQNPCFATDTVTITGQQTIYQDIQPDGTLVFYAQYNGTGISTSGAKYTLSTEVHQLLATFCRR